MTGRVALVTGAARGIGAQTVRELVSQGYRVAAVDSCAEGDRPDGVNYDLASRADLDALAAELGEAVLVQVADVRDRGALAAAAAGAVSTFGRLDVAVAAAAVMIGGTPLWEAPESHLDTLLDVDVRGVWNTAAVTVPHLLASPEPTQARFVAIASAAAEHGMFHLAAYNAAKHAVVGLVKGLAADLVGTGVTACAVSPGSTATAMLDATAAIYGVSLDELASHQLLRRTIAPGEMAATIAFCCSPAAAVLNGSVVSADGGFGG